MKKLWSKNTKVFIIVFISIFICICLLFPFILKAYANNGSEIAEANKETKALDSSVGAFYFNVDSDKYYKTLFDAFEEALPGCTIRLLNNASKETYAYLPNGITGVTLDLQNYSINFKQTPENVNIDLLEGASLNIIGNAKSCKIIGSVGQNGRIFKLHNNTYLDLTNINVNLNKQCVNAKFVGRDLKYDYTNLSIYGGSYDIKAFDFANNIENIYCEDASITSTENEGAIFYNCPNVLINGGTYNALTQLTETETTPKAYFSYNSCYHIKNASVNGVLHGNFDTKNSEIVSGAINGNIEHEWKKPVNLKLYGGKYSLTAAEIEQYVASGYQAKVLLNDPPYNSYVDSAFGSIVNMDGVLTVGNMIDSIPVEISKNSFTLITETRHAFNELNNEEKALLGQERIETLQNAEYQVSQIKQVNETINNDTASIPAVTGDYTLLICVCCLIFMLFSTFICLKFKKNK